MKTLNMIVIALIGLTACGAMSATTQQDTIPGGVKALLDSRQFIFKASVAQPLSGRSVILNTGEYDVVMRKDTLVSTLPYFGRAFSAPLSGEGGIRFTATDFDYTVTPGKRGRYTVLISMKENIDVLNMSFSVAEGGNASLTVTSKNRQSISFNGTISPLSGR